MPLTLFYRTGCSLCEQMMLELEPLQRRYGFELDLQDIDASADLQMRFNVRVPVLMAGDKLLCEHFLDVKRLHMHFS